MNKKFNLVINASIIVLIIALVSVMMNYYTDTDSNIIPTNLDIMENDIILSNSDEKNIISNDIKDEKIPEDNIINIQSGEDEKENNNSGDINIEEPPKTNKEDKEQEENKTVIMTSENDISSKEKREILTEIDKTLMELLDVVDKVQTVDESRLIIDDGEVQK